MPPPPPPKKLYRLGVKFASIIIDGWERFQHSAWENAEIKVDAVSLKAG